MKYVIIGAGGTGGCIGAYLAKAGHDVTFIARGAHLEAMNKNGLTLKSSRIGDHVLNVKACTMDEYNNTPDVIFVCVKYYSIDESIAFVNRVATKNTIVIPILNVFGTGGVMQEKCPLPTILDGCIYIVSMIEAPGVVIQPTSIFRVFFGFRKDQKLQLDNASAAINTCEKVKSDLENAGIDAYFTDNILKEALQKFSFVSPMGAAGLYHHATGKDFMKPGEVQDDFFSLVSEVEKLGNAMGITFNDDLIEINRTIMNGLKPEATTSMQRDVYAGKPSEIDGLVYRIVRLGKEYGLSLPTYEKIASWAEKNI